MGVRLLLAAVCLTTLVSASLFAADASVDPTYEGKPLSAWLEELPHGELYTVLCGPPPAPRRAFRAFRVHRKQAIPALVRRSRDKSEIVRRNVYMALGEIGPDARDAVPVLVRGLRENERALRREAIVALGKIGPPAVDAIPALVEVLHDASQDGQRTTLVSARALAEIGPEAIPSLVDAARSQSVIVRSAALESLGALHDSADDPRRIADVLRAAFADPEPDITSTAMRELFRFGADARGSYRTLAELALDRRTERRYPPSIDVGTEARQVLYWMLATNTLRSNGEFLSEMWAHEAQSPRDAALRIEVLGMIVAGLRERLRTAMLDIKDRLPQTTTLRRFPQWPVLEFLVGAVELNDRVRTRRLARDPVRIDERDDALYLVRFWNWKDPAIAHLLDSYLELDGRYTTKTQRVITACIRLQIDRVPPRPSQEDFVRDPEDVLWDAVAGNWWSIFSSFPNPMYDDGWWDEVVRGARRKPAIRKIVASALWTCLADDGPQPALLDLLCVVTPRGEFARTDVLEALHDIEPDERSTAIYVLGASGAAARPDLPKVLDAMRDDFAEVRRAAIWAAPRIVGAERSHQRDRLVAGLVATLADPDPVTRRDAAAALAPFGPAARDGASALRKLLEDRHAIVRHAARGTLRALGEVRE